MLEVEHLRFSYGKREVLRGVDLRVEPGELVFVLGANGAGKTTLFRCISVQAKEKVPAEYKNTG